MFESVDTDRKPANTNQAMAAKRRRSAHGNGKIGWHRKRCASETVEGLAFSSGGRRFSRGTLGALVVALLDASGLARKIAEVGTDQTGATDFTAAHHFDAVDARRVNRENSLDADAAVADLRTVNDERRPW